MKNSHAIRLLTAVTALCLLATCATGQDLSARADEYLRAQMKVNHFSGAVLIASEGKTLFAKGYGLANAEWNIPNSPQTKFRLGSITKQFTSMAVMQLQQQGKLSVQDPICKYFQDCPKAWQSVTIHNLLTHTSGIPSYTDSPDYRKKMMVPASKDEMISRFHDLPLQFDPGERYRYSNSGYFLLGIIIEKASGKSYEDVLINQIFEPLGMKDTGYDHSEMILPSRASGYSLRSGHLSNAAYLDMNQPFSAGSLYSTVGDLLIWDQALYTEKLLPQKALDTVFTPVKGDYAYGWMVRAPSTASSNRKMIGHGGGINGFSTFISRFVADKATVVVLSNLESANSSRIASDLAAILFGAKYELPRERVEAN